MSIVSSVAPLYNCNVTRLAVQRGCTQPLSRRAFSPRYLLRQPRALKPADPVVVFSRLTGRKRRHQYAPFFLRRSRRQICAMEACGLLAQHRCIAFIKTPATCIPAVASPVSDEPRRPVPLTPRLWSHTPLADEHAVLHGDSSTPQKLTVVKSTSEADGTAERSTGASTGSVAGHPIISCEKAIDHRDPSLPPTSSIDTVCEYISSSSNHCTSSIPEVTAPVGSGGWCLSDALFCLKDMHSTCVTHVGAEERVAHEMPLLQSWMREGLFIESGWLDQLTNDDAETVKKGTNFIATPSVDAYHKSAPHYANVIGRTPIVRYLLLQFMHQPHLWFDEVTEILELAAASCVLSEAVCVPHSLQQSPSQVVLYSFGLLELFHRLIESTSHWESLTIGSQALWEAFVLTHRQDASLLLSPQRPPFSFGEVEPYLSRADLNLRCFSAPAKPRDLRSLHIPPAGDSVSEKGWNEFLFGSVGAAATATNVHGIYVVDEYDGEEPAPSAAVAHVLAVRAASDGGSGVCLAADQEATGNMADDSKSSASYPPSSDAMTDIELMEQRRTEALLLRMYEKDTFLLGLIEPSHFFSLQSWGEMPEPEPEPCASAVPETDKLPVAEDEKEAAPQVPAPPEEEAPPARKRIKRHSVSGAGLTHEYFLGGVFRNSLTGELEDVHLSALWRAFQDAEFSFLLDQYFQVRGQMPSLMEAVREEVAAQYALLLLFFARDEVRAVTPPFQTYQNLWSLHYRLRAVLQSETFPSVLPVPSFADLPADAQASYACFSCSHLPPVGVALSEDGIVSSRPPMPSSGISSPRDLYRAYLALYDARMDAGAPLEISPTSSTDSTDTTASDASNLEPAGGDVALQPPADSYKAGEMVQRCDYYFDSLTPLQLCAIEFCFPSPSDGSLELASPESRRCHRVHEHPVLVDDRRSDSCASCSPAEKKAYPMLPWPAVSAIPPRKGIRGRPRREAVSVI